MRKGDGRMDSDESHSFVKSEEEELEEDGGQLEKPMACKKWRKVTFALNAVWRFQQTMSVKIEIELKNGELITKFKTVTHVLLAAQRFKAAEQKFSDDPIPKGFGVGPDHLVRLMQDQHLGAIGLHNVLRCLGVDGEGGIDDNADEVERRKEAFGNNKIPPKPPKSFWFFVWEASKDTTLRILIVCALLSLGTEMWADGVKEGWYDGVSILAAVFIVIVVTGTSDYRQSLQFIELSDVKKNIQVDVIRGDRRQKISIFDVVVGEIVFINIGDQVPADGLLLSGQSLVIDESSMTGESLPVSKDVKHPFLLAGCKVMDGYGKMVVTSVGIRTEWGQVMATLTEDNGEATPLQVRLNGAATFIGQIGLMVAVVVFFILFTRFFATDFKDNKKASYAVKRIVSIFSIAVTILVVAVPEGLPLAVTLTLAYSMRKMMNDKALVRNLAACETMGSATTICSDKTGTLTLNKMSVARSWVSGQLLDAVEVKNRISHELYQTLVVGICQNSSGSVYSAKGGEVEISGSPTESAALAWGVQIGMHFDGIRRDTAVIRVETFNSEKKRAGVVVKDGDSYKAHWKGAAEMILEISEKWVDADGSIQVMTADNAREFTNQIEGMAAASLRCIAFAYKELQPEQIPLNDEVRLKTWKIPDEGLVFVAVIGIKDPCRPGVREAVGKCQAAGVKVRMVTGDSVITAKAIAEECGILSSGGIVVEGKDFRFYDEEQLDRILPKLDVMARSSPSDKLLLVKALKARGEVVGVTGDGTNDAPALHHADVGLSMGIAGTEVAKESSDIVILDDNFASIVKVVRWGRSVYANIQKFIQFQLTVNVTALVINFVSATSSGEVPLTAVQLLWVNLIMDTLGALALATEAPTDDLMERTPVGRTEPLITNVMWRNLFGQAFYQIAVLLTINYAGVTIFGLENEKDGELIKNTIVFNAFVFCQIFNEVNARRPEKKNIFQGLHRNYLFMGIIVCEAAFQFLIVQFLRKFASTHSLTWQQWLICIAIGIVSWPLAFLLKFLRVREKPYFNARRIRLKWKRPRHPLAKSLSRSSSAAGDIEGSESGERSRVPFSVSSTV